MSSVFFSLDLEPLDRLSAPPLLRFAKCDVWFPSLSWSCRSWNRLDKEMLKSSTLVLFFSNDVLLSVVSNSFSASAADLRLRVDGWKPHLRSSDPNILEESSEFLVYAHMVNLVLCLHIWRHPSYLVYPLVLEYTAFNYQVIHGAKVCEWLPIFIDLTKAVSSHHLLIARVVTSNLSFEVAHKEVDVSLLAILHDNC